MRIASISDLHLGVRDRAERFGHSEEGFSRFLDALEANFEIIVVNGDLFETWQGERFGRPAEAYRACVRAWPGLAARLRDPPYALTYGNHDPILAEQGVPRERTYCVDGIRVLFTHGHRFDPPLKRATPLAYTFSFATGWLHRHQEHPLMSRVEALRARGERRHLYNVSPPAVIERLEEAGCPYLAGAGALLRSRSDLDVVVCGHTHVAAHTRTPWGVYLNSGAMAGGRFSWVAIDTSNRSYLVLDDEPNVAEVVRRLDAPQPDPHEGRRQ